MKHSKHLPLAIVGPGTIARAAHVPALALQDTFQLVACVSDAAGLDGMPCVASIDALDPEVQAVSICTPPQVRGGIARKALQAGRHVLLEKPPAATLSECASLAALAQERGVTLFAAWHSRFAAGVSPARAWLDGRRITGGQVTWHENVRQFHPGQTWLWQPGGLGVFDPGINALSILTEICPVPLSLRTAAFTVPDGAATPIAARVVLDAGGAAIELDLDFRVTGPPCWRIDLQTDGGTLRVEDGGAAASVEGTALPTTDEGEYPALYRHFADLIARGRSDCDTAPLALVADAFMVAHSTPAPPFTP